MTYNHREDGEFGEGATMTMQVDKARLGEVEAAARAMCVEGGFDPDEIMPNDGSRWRYYAPGAVAAIRSLRSTEGKEGASLGAAINFAEAYAAGYEFDDGDGGFHTPTEAERLVMLDMINGLFSEDGFVAALTRSPE